MPLNESPSEKEGKFGIAKSYIFWLNPSMKVPPKRKGNQPPREGAQMMMIALNESPSEKEGKLEARL